MIAIVSTNLILFTQQLISLCLSLFVSMCFGMSTRRICFVFEQLLEFDSLTHVPLLQRSEDHFLRFLRIGRSDFLSQHFVFVFTQLK